MNLSGANIIILIILQFYSVPGTIFALQIPSYLLVVDFVRYLFSCMKLSQLQLGLTENNRKPPIVI